MGRFINPFTDVGFKRLEEITEVASLSKHERLKYDEGLRKYRDTLSVLDGAMQDGLAQGMAQGVQIEKIDTARRLLAIGASADVIMTATGLSAEEIANIK